MFIPLEIKNQGKDTDKCLFYAIASCFEIEDRIIYDPDQTYEDYKKLNPGFGADFKKAAKFCCKYGFLVKDMDCFRVKKLYRKPFFVEKSTDIFESILKYKNKPILVGAKWKPEWSYYQDGLIEDSDNEGAFFHAFVVLGEKEGRLACQLSNGEDIGDKGIVYFPKEVVNKNFYNLFAYFDYQLPFWMRFINWVFTKLG